MGLSESLIAPQSDLGLYRSCKRDRVLVDLCLEKESSEEESVESQALIPLVLTENRGLRLV